MSVLSVLVDVLTKPLASTSGMRHVVCADARPVAFASAAGAFMVHSDYVVKPVFRKEDSIGLRGLNPIVKGQALQRSP